MLESSIEKKLCSTVKKAGGRPYKFVSPGAKGVPDRLCLFPVKKRHQAIVSKYVKFVELKTPDGSLSPLQKVEIKRLKDMGFYVSVIDEKVNDVEEI